VRRRLEEFREVFERSYFESERIEGGGRWRFRAASGLESRLRSLATREHACCRFFRFEIRAVGDEVWWDTRVDDLEAQPVLEEFFTLPIRLSEREGVEGVAFWPGHTQKAASDGDS
jgi:hypothetical protein